MSFRQYGGINYAARNNIVRNNYSNANILSVMTKVGQPASYINFESDISGNTRFYGNLDISGNLFVSGNIFLKENLFVDGNIILNENLNVNGDTALYGTLDVSGNTNAYQIHLTGDINTYQDATSVVPKSYVDGISAGIHPTVACQLATAETSLPISLSGNQLIDGILTVTGYRVLVNNQGYSAGTNNPAVANGIYIASSSAWTRATDCSGNNVQGQSTFIQLGTTNSKKTFIQTASGINPAFAGTNPLLYVVYNQLNLQLGQGLEFVVNSSTLQMKSNLSSPSFITSLTVSGPLTITGSDALINGLTIGKGNGSISTNTAIGFEALKINTSGYDNTAIGYSSSTSNLVGKFNTAVGAQTLLNNVYDANTAVGALALKSNTSGGGNVSIGYEALYLNNTGRYNVSSGYQSLSSNTSGERNVAVGTSSLGNNVSGNYNTGLGDTSGANSGGNTSNNTFLGHYSGVEFSTIAYTNSTALGAYSTITASNQVVLGGTGTTEVKIPFGGLTVSTGLTTLNSGLTVSGTTTLNSSLNINGAINLTAGLTVSGATNLNSTLGVTGATTLSSTLGVTGDTTLSGTLSSKKPIYMTGTLNTDRIINNIFYQLQDTNNLSTTVGQIYAGSGIFNYDNDIVGGRHTFATNNSSGVQTTPLTFTSADLTINTTNCPTMTGFTLPPSNENSSKIATTAWVQTAVGSSSYWIASGSNIYYNSGNVGIGTNAPSKNLDVVGTLGVSGTTNLNNQLTVSSSSVSTYQGGFIYNNQTAEGTLLSSKGTVTEIKMNNGATYHFTISNNGSSFNINDTSVNEAPYTLGDSLMCIKPYSTGGNVGIGTTNPIKKLDVVGTLGVSGLTTLSGGLTVTGSVTASSFLGNATTATSIAGGGAGQVPYNTGSGATLFVAAGTAGQVLQSNGTGAPTWSTNALSSYALLASPTFTGTPSAPTALAGTNSTQIATTAFVQRVGTMVGEIKMWGGLTLPSGYLWCDGAFVSQTTYASLFAVIGTVYGSSGSNFQLPNLLQKFPIGSKDSANMKVDYTNPSGVVQQLNTGGNQTMNANQLAQHTHNFTNPTVSTSTISNHPNFVSSVSANNSNNTGNGSSARTVTVDVTNTAFS